MKKRVFLPFLILLLTFLPNYSKSDSEQWENQLKKYARIYTLISELYPGQVDKEDLVFSSINGFLKGLDPHSYFLDPLSLRSMNEDQQGNYFGIGTRITKYEDRLTVVAPIEGSPAHKLGILAGDVIAEIEGQDTKDMLLDDAMKLLRGAKGTYVNIKVRRDRVEKLIPFKIQRAEIPLDSISYAVVIPDQPRIGYIRIRTFGGTTAKEFREHLERLTGELNIEALVIDLRWNAGGALYSAIDLSELFLEKDKVIVSVKGRKLDRSFKARKNGQYEDMPLAILINRVSASASEILASAVQDHKKGVIVGTRSWGKGLVQTVYELPLNSSLALTTAKYYTPGNKCLQRDFSKLEEYYSILSSNDYDTDTSIQGGVIPDILVKSRLNPEMIIDFISSGVFFGFSRDLIDNGYPVAKDFRADKAVLKKFKNYLKENKIAYDEDSFKKNLAFIQENIEREVISSKFSPPEGFKVFLRADPVTQRAVEVLLKKMKEND